MSEVKAPRRVVVGSGGRFQEVAAGMRFKWLCGEVLKDERLHFTRLSHVKHLLFWTELQVEGAIQTPRSSYHS